MRISGTAVDCIPTASPWMMFVAAPVSLCDAISRACRNRSDV
jgi:hypothetical protein